MKTDIYIEFYKLEVIQVQKYSDNMMAESYIKTMRYLARMYKW